MSTPGDLRWDPEVFNPRIEAALRLSIDEAKGPGCPPKLRMAMESAVFPGGARLRPTLCVAVAAACGTDRPDLADRAAAAIELIHCASLTHDDLACFDNAEYRRGKRAVHVEFGEPMAVLAGDALIVSAFKTLLGQAAQDPQRSIGMLSRLARAVETNGGIIAGQAWEFEDSLDLNLYHRTKTGSLFEAAAADGALSAGCDPAPWESVGAALGEAYQVADDIADLMSGPDVTGKPAGQDRLLGRPNVATEIGIPEATKLLHERLGIACSGVPSCRYGAEFQEWLAKTTKRIMAHRLGVT